MDPDISLIFWTYLYLIAWQKVFEAAYKYTYSSVKFKNKDIGEKESQSRIEG